MMLTLPTCARLKVWRQNAKLDFAEKERSKKVPKYINMFQTNQKLIPVKRTFMYSSLKMCKRSLATGMVDKCLGQCITHNVSMSKFAMILLQFKLQNKDAAHLTSSSLDDHWTNAPDRMRKTQAIWGWNWTYTSVNLHLWNGQCRTPLLLENIQANTPIAIDVWMEHLCSKSNLYR